MHILFVRLATYNPTTHAVKQEVINYAKKFEKPADEMSLSDSGCIVFEGPMLFYLPDSKKNVMILSQQRKVLGLSYSVQTFTLN